MSVANPHTRANLRQLANLFFNYFNACDDYLEKTADDASDELQRSYFKGDADDALYELQNFVEFDMKLDDETLKELGEDPELDKEDWKE